MQAVDTTTNIMVQSVWRTARTTEQTNALTSSCEPLCCGPGIACNMENTHAEAYWEGVEVVEEIHERAYNRLGLVAVPTFASVEKNLTKTASILLWMTHCIIEGALPLPWGRNQNSLKIWQP